MARKIRAPLALTDDLVDAVAARVRAEGFVSTRALLPGKVSPAEGQLLAEKLAARGIERTGRGARVDVATQITVVLADAGPAPLAALARRVKGATAAETRRAAAELLATARLARVVVEGRERIALPGPQLLGDAEVDALRALSADLARLAAALRVRKVGPRRTLRRDALSALAATLAVLASGPAPTVPDAATLLAALASLERERGRAVFLPELLRRAGAERDPPAAHRVLFELARAGRVELRPESGVDNLPEADRALCPADGRGAVVSYVRALGGASS